MTTLIVRPAQERDRTSLREAAILSWLDVHVGLFAQEVIDDAPAMIDRALDKRLHRMRIALDRAAPDHVLGWYSLGDTEEEKNYLWHLYVRPDVQRRGVGRALHTAALDELKQRGASVATLDVLEENAKGRAFWQAMGWHETGRQYEDGHWLILMERTVS